MGDGNQRKVIEVYCGVKFPDGTNYETRDFITKEDCVEQFNKLSSEDPNKVVNLYVVTLDTLFEKSLQLAKRLEEILIPRVSNNVKDFIYGKKDKTI